MNTTNHQPTTEPPSDSGDCSDFRCPCCDCEIAFHVTAAIPKSQTLTVELKSEGVMIGAEIVASTIESTAHVITESARSLGVKVAVFVKDIRVTNGSVLIELTSGVVG